MKILVAEYASALGMGGTCELEGRAMLSTLVESFERSGHTVTYATHGPRIRAGDYILVNDQSEFEVLLETVKVDACLLIAPDDLQPRFLEIIEDHTANLGSTPGAARVAADKRLCTQALARAGVPVAEIVDKPDPVEKGCHLYVVKPRTGCGSEGVRITSFVRAGPDEIVTRYHEGLHLSASFIVGQRGLFAADHQPPAHQFRGRGHKLPGKPGALQHAPGGRDLGRRQRRRLLPWALPGTQGSTSCWASGPGQWT